MSSPQVVVRSAKAATARSFNGSRRTEERHEKEKFWKSRNIGAIGGFETLKYQVWKGRELGRRENKWKNIMNLKTTADQTTAERER